jgi:transcriptional regulator GlxA family with amidase domain
MASILPADGPRFEWQDRLSRAVFCHHRRMRRVGVLLHSHTRLFDYGVIHEVFGVDRSDGGLPVFQVWRCAVRPGRQVAVDGGASVRSTHGLAALAEADLVLVPGADPAPSVASRAEVAALRAAHAAGVPIAALCSGAFLLADAGLLDGRRATTHWRLTDALAARCPAARVERGPLWIQDGSVPWSGPGAGERSLRSTRHPGGILTAAGTAAGIDLCLHLVRQAYGATAAAGIARRLVTPPHRGGDQSQFVERAVVPLPDPLTEVLAWARDNLHRPLTVTTLARRARLSERTFARRFTGTTGTTPLRWLHHQRVQLAQELLERTGLGVDEVARRVGFGTAPVLRRHFTRDVGTTPTAYRQRFAA